jgi:nicotinamide phosphoribosyltransferase
MTEFTSEFKDQIMSRTPDENGNAKVVFRPDSGNPIDIICGTAVPVETIEDALPTDKDTVFVMKGEYFKIVGDSKVTVTPTPEQKGSLQCLWDVFGGTENGFGYKVLDPHVGLIYGDSITLERAEAILDKMERLGFASSNIVFGVGSYSYQMISRDTFGFAMKATSAVINGERRALFKNPKTDSAKKSACGLLQVLRNEDGEFYLNDNCTEQEEEQSELQTVYYGGIVTRASTLNDIRAKLMV